MNQNTKIKIVTGPTGELFDDCAVCRLIKKCQAEGWDPTEEEAEAAMKETEKQGGTVGDF